MLWTFSVITIKDSVISKNNIDNKNIIIILIECLIVVITNIQMIITISIFYHKLYKPLFTYAII